MKKDIDEVEMQRQYYAQTAKDYDPMHVNEGDEHFFALSFLLSTLDFYGIRSILDIGSGTGRVPAYVKSVRPDITIIGIEPVKELREIGYKKGLLCNELIDGDATQLRYEDGEFDMVCEFAALHHIKHPELVVAEMLRVSRKAIFISDSNNYGQGAPLMRAVKQMINFVGLWKAADFIKTKGKGYMTSDGDGLAYSYSVFNNYKQIRQACRCIHFLNTMDGGPNLYRTAGHIALLGVKSSRLP